MDAAFSTHIRTLLNQYLFLRSLSKLGLDGGLVDDPLELERATLSGIIATLVRKGLVRQTSTGEDQRQRLLTLTRSGEALWRVLPDLSFIHHAAFVGIDETDLATTIRVLRLATERLQTLSRMV